jgi:ABC-type Mn2+/Zn2+ transport system permease subunit
MASVPHPPTTRDRFAACAGILRLAGRRRLVVGYGLGAAGYAVGLAASALWDLPSGAVIVWTLALCGLGVALWPRSTVAAALTWR